MPIFVAFSVAPNLGVLQLHSPIHHFTAFTQVVNFATCKTVIETCYFKTAVTQKFHIFFSEVFQIRFACIVNVIIPVITIHIAYNLSHCGGCIWLILFYCSQHLELWSVKEE